MGRTSKMPNKYAGKSGTGGHASAGPTLCIDTIADPSALQRHIQTLMQPSTRLTWEEFKEKHKDQLEDRMGSGIEKETRQHRERLDEERRLKLARGVNREKEAKALKRHKKARRAGREGDSDGEAEGKPVRLSDFQKGRYADTSESDVSRHSSRSASPTPAWLLPMSAQEAAIAAGKRKAANDAAAGSSSLAPGHAGGQSAGAEYTLLAIRILTRVRAAVKRGAGAGASGDMAGGEAGSAREVGVGAVAERKRRRWSDCTEAEHGKREDVRVGAREGGGVVSGGEHKGLEEGPGTGVGGSGLGSLASSVARVAAAAKRAAGALCAVEEVNARIALKSACVHAQGACGGQAGEGGGREAGWEGLSEVLEAIEREDKATRDGDERGSGGEGEVEHGKDCEDERQRSPLERLKAGEGGGEGGEGGRGAGKSKGGEDVGVESEMDKRERVRRRERDKDKKERGDKDKKRKRRKEDKKSRHKSKRSKHESKHKRRRTAASSASSSSGSSDEADEQRRSSNSTEQRCCKGTRWDQHKPMVRAPKRVGAAPAGWTSLTWESPVWVAYQMRGGV